MNHSSRSGALPKVTAINKYGAIARSHWARTDPARFQTIEDPETFFAQLGEQAETQIQEMTDRLAGPDQPGEEYLQKVGRLNMARLQAEEAVLADLVWIPQPGEATEEPATDWVTQTMRAIHDADPEAFFGQLGEQVESQVQELAQTLAGPDQPGEEYLQKVGRLNMARLQAEEAVLTDLVWISGPEEDEEPATDWVTQTMREMYEADPDNEPPLD